MKKFIVKTALITLITVFVVSMIAIIGISVLSPRTMASFSFNVGNEKVGVWYTELSYQKTGNVDDLKNVIYRSADIEDYKKVEKYATILTEREDFAEICAKDGDAFYNKLVLAMYKNGKTADEIFVVADKTLVNGYTETNAYRGFIYGGYVSGDSEFISALKVKFNSFDYSSAIFTSDKTYLEDLT